MSEKKIVVPEGMLRAAYSSHWIDVRTPNWDETDHITKQFYLRIFTAALRWLSENPLVPTKDQIDSIINEWRTPSGDFMSYDRAAIDVAVEWQRRMFLQPEPEIPEEVKDLLWDGKFNGNVGLTHREDHDCDVLEAYRRGQKAALR